MGDLVYIQGEMANQKYTTPEGQERENHYIIAHSIQPMPKTREQRKAPEEQQEPVVVVDDNIPW